jgi:hypothetical protein
MAAEKARIRQAGGQWVCTRPAFGFGSSHVRIFRSWRSAMDWATTPTAGTVACADLQLAGQASDAISAIPVWTPLTFQ